MPAHRSTSSAEVQRRFPWIVIWSSAKIRARLVRATRIFEFTCGCAGITGTVKTSRCGLLSGEGADERAGCRTGHPSSGCMASRHKSDRARLLSFPKASRISHETSRLSSGRRATGRIGWYCGGYWKPSSGKISTLLDSIWLKHARHLRQPIAKRPIRSQSRASRQNGCERHLTRGLR